MRAERAASRFLRRLIAVSMAWSVGHVVAQADDAWKRQEEVIRLGSIRPVTPEAMAQLIAALRDPSVYVRAEAVRRLGQIGPGARSAVPELLRLLTVRDADPLARMEVPWALGSAGRGDPRVLDTLIQVAEGFDEGLITRGNAIQTLGGMREAAQQAEPALLAVAKTQAPMQIRVRAWEAVLKMNSENQEAIEALRELAAGDPRTFVEGTEGVHSAGFHPVRYVWQALSEAGRGAEVFPYLVSALNHDSLEVQAISLDLLSKMGLDAKAAVPAILRILERPTENSDQRSLKGYAIGALLQIDPPSQESALSLLRTSDPELHELMQRRLEGRVLGNTSTRQPTHSQTR